jgi:chemotaxis protein MotA
MDFAHSDPRKRPDVEPSAAAPTTERDFRMHVILRYRLPLACILLVVIAVLVGDGMASFVHLPSLALTLGGTALVTFLSFPKAQLHGLAAAVRQAIREHQPDRSSIEQVKELARRYRLDGVAGLEAHGIDVSNRFLRRGLELLLEWKSASDLRSRLEAEHLRTVTHYEDCRRTLQTIGKLLPAFGLIGTLAGLILLLRDPGELTADRVGPAMSLAILTTLYGAVLANGVVLPMEAKLQMFIDHLRIQYEIGLRATSLIADRAYPSTIEEQLGGILPPEEPEERDGSPSHPAGRTEETAVGGAALPGEQWVEPLAAAVGHARL